VNYSPLHERLKELGAISSENQGWYLVSSFGNPKTESQTAREHVVLVDLSASAKIYIEGRAACDVVEAALDAAAAGLAVGAGLDAGHFGVYRLRQDRFLVHSGPGEADALLKKLGPAAAASESLVTVTDLTHGRAEIGVIGPKAPTLLSRLCGLDFSGAHFPDMAAKQSSVAKTSQLILRHDIGAVPAFALLGDRSFGVYLWETAFDAAKDLAVGVAGMEALANLSGGGRSDQQGQPN